MTTATPASTPPRPVTAESADVPAGSIRALGWLNFFVADLQAAVGPFLAIYLAAQGWNQEKVGLALTLGGAAGIIAQTPAGALVDRIKAKRGLIALASLILCLGALCIALQPLPWTVYIAQAAMGAAGSVIAPAICAITLGLTGPRLFDRQQGRNQAFNAAGNIFASVAVGAVAWMHGDKIAMLTAASFAVPAVSALLWINPRDIDHRLARGFDRQRDASLAPPRRLFRHRALLLFLGCAVLFHFSNAAMLPLVGQQLARGQGSNAMAFMAACIVTTQVIVAIGSPWVGRAAATLGRRKLLLAGFAVLPLRGLLYASTDHPALLILIQLLDGVGAVIFGVVSILVIADLTAGTGRFNLAAGVMATAVGIGAAASQGIAGAITHAAGFQTGMLFLACIGGCAFFLFWAAMPETLRRPCSINQATRSLS